MCQDSPPLDTLPGGQYARGWVSHQAKDIVVAPGAPILYCQRQLFCFDAFLSASGQTSRMGMVRQGSSLTCLSIRIGLQGRKSGESNKLFDLFLPRTGHESVLSVKSVVEKEPQALRCLEGTTMSNRGHRPRILIAYHQVPAWRAVRHRTGSWQV